jgi:hypothetical protein
MPFFIDDLKQAGLFDSLGYRLLVIAGQPECAAGSRPASHGAAVGAGRASTLRAHHDAAMR